MSWKEVQLIVLHCDQGMGNLIKIYTDVGGTKTLSHLALIDLGSDSKKWRFAGDAIDIVIAALHEMTVPKIDLLVISHQDKDHWNLLPDLRMTIKKEDKFSKLTIGRLVTAGEAWVKGPINEVSNLERAFKCSEEKLSTFKSDYLLPPSLAELIDLAGVKFRVLAANARKSPTGGRVQSKMDLIRNGTSAVIVVDCGVSQFVLPGDATAETCAFVNETLDKWTRPGGSNPLTKCIVLSVPHHGAIRTLADNFNRLSPTLNMALNFANLMSAQIVAASAGFKSKHKHPYKRVLTLLAPKAVNNRDLHDYVCWDDYKADWEENKDTKAGIYTTISSTNDPPVRKSWPFFVESTGKWGFEMVERGGPTERPPARLTARPARVLGQQGTGQPLAASPDVAAVAGRPGPGEQAPRRVVLGT